MDTVAHQNTCEKNICGNSPKLETQMSMIRRMDQGIVEYATQRIISFSNENEQPTVYATTRKNLTNVNLCLALFTQQVYHV